MDKKKLEQYVKDRLTTYEIAEKMRLSQTNVRYWLKKYKLKTVTQRGAKRRWTDEDLYCAIESSFTIAGVIRKLGLKQCAGNYGTIKKHVKRLSLDISHFTGVAHGAARVPRKGKPLNEIMVKNSTYSRSHLKNRLLKEGKLKNQCAICRLGNNWNEKLLVMVLDHINGISNDHRFENLRILCPNCNSQQPTFSRGTRRAVECRCIDCGNKISVASTRCNGCAAINRGCFKIDWPSCDILKQMVDELGRSETGRRLGISDNAVKKHLKVHCSSP